MRLYITYKSYNLLTSTRARVQHELQAAYIFYQNQTTDLNLCVFVVCLAIICECTYIVYSNLL